VELRVFPAGAEFGEVFAGELCIESFGIGLPVHWRDQPPEPLGTALERVAFELGDQPLAIGQRQLAALEQAREVERELEDGIEQRCLFGAPVQRLETFGEVGDGPQASLLFAKPNRKEVWR